MQTISGNLLLGGVLVQGRLTIDSGRIARIERGETLPASTRAHIVAPGFVDLQVNGGFGVEVGHDPEAFRTLAARLPSTGVTTFLPTAVSAEPQFYPGLFAAFSAAANAPGARMLGLHLEGPLINPERRGAHRREVIEGAGGALLDMWEESSDVRLVTLAPERNDALDWIRRLTARGILVSLGHTAGTYEEVIAGADAGARMATHLYNAMSPFAHRAPGAIGAALTDERLTAGLIPDGVHSHPAALRLAMKSKGAAGIAIVTDMMAASGMGPGQYTLGTQAVSVDETSARLADGTLAGSVLTMEGAVRNMVEWSVATPADALRMAAHTPSTLLGLPGGQLVEGCVADLVLLDADLSVLATLVGGDIVYERGATRSP